MEKKKREIPAKERKGRPGAPEYDRRSGRKEGSGIDSDPIFQDGTTSPDLDEAGNPRRPGPKNRQETH